MKDRINNVFIENENITRRENDSVSTRLDKLTLKRKNDHDEIQNDFVSFL